jgi:hypothetical protein
MTMVSSANGLCNNGRERNFKDGVERLCLIRLQVWKASTAPTLPVSC